MYITKSQQYLWCKCTDSEFLSQRDTKTYCWQNEKILLVVHRSFLHVKQSMTRLSFGNRRTYENLLAELMLTNYTHNRCPDRCRAVFIRVGILIQEPIQSPLVKSKPVALRIRSFLFFNEQDQNVKLKNSIPQADSRKVTASSVMDFVLITTLCLKPWAAFITFVPLKWHVRLSQNKIFNVAVRKESSMVLDELTYKNCFTDCILGVSAGDSVQNNQYR